MKNFTFGILLFLAITSFKTDTNFPCHPLGDLGPCSHAMHLAGDIYPCTHTYFDGWGNLRVMHIAGDIGPCTHPMHSAGDLYPCTHFCF